MHAELRGLLLRAFASLGLLGGLWLGFDHVPSAGDNAECTGQDCVANGLMAGLTPVLLYAVVGLLLGALIGAGLARAVRIEQ